MPKLLLENFPLRRASERANGMFDDLSYAARLKRAKASRIRWTLNQTHQGFVRAVVEGECDLGTFRRDNGPISLALLNVLGLSDFSKHCGRLLDMGLAVED